MSLNKILIIFVTVFLGLTFAQKLALPQVEIAVRTSSFDAGDRIKFKLEPIGNNYGKDLDSFYEVNSTVISTQTHLNLLITTSG